jgi:DNA processing protein
MHRYPPEFQRHEGAILAGGGAVLSPFSPPLKLHRGNFSYRNYIIAGLSPLTLVVEARRRSGSMVTARAAQELGCEVATVPMFPSGTTGMGNLDLLANGGTLIRDAADLLAAWSRQWTKISVFPDVGGTEA